MFDHATSLTGSPVGEFGTSPRRRGLLLLRMAQLRQAAPRELSLKTGWVLTALAMAHAGLTRKELAEFLHPRFHEVSAQFQASMMESTNKLIQRARRRFRPHGISIYFDRSSCRFFVEAVEENSQDLHSRNKVPMAPGCLLGQFLPCPHCGQT